MRYVPKQGNLQLEITGTEHGEPETECRMSRREISDHCMLLFSLSHESYAYGFNTL